MHACVEADSCGVGRSISMRVRRIDAALAARTGPVAAIAVPVSITYCCPSGWLQAAASDDIDSSVPCMQAQLRRPACVIDRDLLMHVLIQPLKNLLHS